MLQRREQEGRGRERRRLLLAKEERRRRELEASVLSSIPTAGNKEVAAVAAAARAVAGDILSEDGKAGEQVSSIAQRVLSRQRAERAQKVVYCYRRMCCLTDIIPGFYIHDWHKCILCFLFC